jgi:hypothetical protein
MSAAGYEVYVFDSLVVCSIPGPRMEAIAPAAVVEAAESLLAGP